MNKVILIGRLTRDIELRYTQKGTARATFTLAVDRRFKNQDGEKETDFINCVIWDKQAENAAKYVGKGSQVGVVGRIQTRSYEAKDGHKVYVTEVVVEEIEFMGGGKTERGSQRSEYDQSPVEDDFQPLEDDDDDLPF